MYLLSLVFIPTLYNKDYMITPEIFGPDLWNSIHLICLGAPDNFLNISSKNDYAMFFRSLGTVIPCYECKKHYLNEIIEYPPKLETNITLFKWSVDLHNRVNKRLNKKELPYEEALEYWKNYKINTFQQKNDNYITWIIIFNIIIILVALILFVYSRTSTC
jgi:hypothetical protein